MRLRDASKTLYYDVKKKVLDHRAPLKKEESTLPDDWEESSGMPARSNYLIYLAIATFFFFFITVGVAYFVQFAGIDRTVSTSKITILTQGPTIIDSGSASPLTVRIANGNPVPIQNATLTIIYPDGTYKEAGEVVRLHRDEFAIGSMETGEVVSKNISPVLYGTDGQKKQIMYEFGYQAQGTSQPTRVSGSHDITIRTTPILLAEPSYTSPVSGKEIQFRTSVQSNMKDVIDAVYVQISYPTGFVPDAFSSSPFNAEGTLWRLSSMRPNERRDVWVKGIINGKERDEQALVVSVFVSPTGRLDESVKVAEESVIFAIERSFIDIDLSLNGSSSDTVVVSPSGNVSARLSWKNLDRDRIEDLVITATLSGNGLDESSIESGIGHFNGPQKQIIWDKKQIRSFSLVRAGGQGELSFSFSALPDRVEVSQPQRNIQVSISARALRAQTKSIDSIDHAVKRQVSLRGILQVAANTLYTTGSWENRGPLPPQVGKRTSYTLKYDVKNSGNPTQDFAMKIPLARDVIFAGQVEGISHDMWSYDEGFNEITIRVPSIAATGQRSSRSIELQVIVEPKPENAGKRLILAKQTSWRARDAYVNETLQGTIPALTTKILAESLNTDERSGIVEPVP